MMKGLIPEIYLPCNVLDNSAYLVKHRLTLSQYSDRFLGGKGVPAGPCNFLVVPLANSTYRIFLGN
jgi:hypothetical protein